MAAGWYLKIADKEVGPLSAGQLKAMAGRGQISPYDPIRQGTDGSWVPAGSIKGLLSAAEAAPAGKSPGPPQGRIPVARAVVTSPGPPACGPPAPGGFHIDTSAADPTARLAGQGKAGSASPKRRRRKDAMVVAAVVLAVVLAAVAAGVVLSRRGPQTASGRAHAAPDEAAGQREPQREEVTIPGLDEYLGEAGPKAPEDAEPKARSTGERTVAAGLSAECGGVTVKIVSAQIGRPRLIRRSTGRAARPRTDYLRLNLELSNTTEERPYLSWNVENTGVRLVDDHENAYSVKSFAHQGMEIDGQVEGGTGSLRREKVTEDVLLFEKPAESATFLRLELPAAAFRQKGSMKFEIPVSMIAAETQAEEEPEPGGPVPEVSRAIAEVDAEKAAATNGHQPQVGRSVPAGGPEASQDRSMGMGEGDDDLPIGIPGVTGEGSKDDDGTEASSFSDDPKLQKAYQELRQQRKTP